MIEPTSNPTQLTVDQAPIGIWLAHTSKVWAKRLTKHALTGESVDSDGISLGEHVVGIAYRGRLPERNDPRHDEKIDALLQTCQDPRSAASVWLRAILPVAHKTPGATEQIDLLADNLAIKLPQLGDRAKLKWAIIALRSAAAVCEKREIEPDQVEACKRLLATAWQAMPETMLYLGKPTLPIRSPDKATDDHWTSFQRHAISILRWLPWHEPLPSEMLALQLWMAPEYDGLSIVDQETARCNHGLVPDSMYGHRALLNALEAKTPWPNDPRVDWMLDWFKEKNPYLWARVVPAVQATSLDRKTPETISSRPKPRL